MKLQKSKIILAIALAVAPAIASAQVDNDLPASVTAGCFSICAGEVNSKGVEGNVDSANRLLSAVNMTAVVKVQCNGVDVPGASQTIGPVAVAANPVQGPPGNPVTFPYSIAFTANGGCAYTVVAVVSSSGLGSRTSTVSTGFTADCIDQPCSLSGAGGGCTLTQGYWKNHSEVWPVNTLTLGSVSYTQAELLSILGRAVKGNGLVSLAHQLIAAKLNLANGTVCTAISASIAAADALIGARVVPPVGADSLSTSATSSLVAALEMFNNGLTVGCPGHCSVE